MKLPYKWQATLVVCLGMIMAILDTTIVSVTLPQIQKAFHTDFGTITWVATAYFLAQAAVIPIVGYLSDHIGTKTVFLTSLAVFTFASALCALAPTKEMLIVFRTLQGIGGGALMPVAFAVIYREFLPTERAMATAVVGIPLLMAPAFGPTIGGYLSSTFNWSTIFTVNIPIGILTFILALMILRGRKQEYENNQHILEKKRFDILGLLLSMVGFTTLVYGITEAGRMGWSSPTVLISIIVGGGVLIAFVITELTVKDPVIDMRLFTNYTFMISNLLIWMVSAMFFGSLFLLPFFFENVQGYSSLTAGVLLISQGLGAAVGMTIAGRLYNNVGPRRLVVTGLILLTVGTYGFTRLNVHTSGQSLQIWLFLRGLGLGCVNTPLQTLALSVVIRKAIAKASSLMSVTRQVFGAIGVTVLTTYLTQQTLSYGSVVRASVQSGHAVGFAASCVKSAGQNFTPALKNCVLPYLTTMGLNDTFLVVTIICSICAVLAVFLGRDPAIEAAKRAKGSDGEGVVERATIQTE
jgi:EmrB/QacA subfamily drug resistance transporter